MASETDLLNDALGQAGCTPIGSIDDNTVNAQWCKRLYPQLRKGLLRQHHWNFAEARAQLTADSVAPLFEFVNAFTLPVDCLKLKEYNGNAMTVVVTLEDPAFVWVGGYFKIEGRKILSNDAQAFIVYVKDVANPDLWDALFYQTMAAWLASKLAMAIKHDSAKSGALMQQAVGNYLPLTLAVDGQEGTVVPYQVNDLTWGR